MGTFGGRKLAVFFQNNNVLQYSASVTVQLLWIRTPWYSCTDL